MAGRPQHDVQTLLPLRAFLGLTFCFAGLQKLSNPNFFNPANPASIQSQLAGAARRSPLHGLLGGLGHVAVPLGVLIAFAELAIGLGTVLGLYTRLAAGGGVLLSLSLFLTVSFHANPFYTGSDIVFVFAWTPLLIGGPGRLSADTLLADAARRTAPAGMGGAVLDRRSFAVRGAAAGVLGLFGLVTGGLSAGIGRLAGGSTSSRQTRSLGAAPPSTRTAPTTPATPNPATSPPPPPTTTTSPRPPGTRIGPASSVPVGGAASFQDPGTGDPSLVVQPERGVFLAFDAVCPHAGCPVEYSASDRSFVCPCHGSQFNGRTGAVEVGPAQSGLTRIAIAEDSDGQLYAK
ncbi:MAG TPA: Rieske 2Fe-2S domain-containing protein [Acidimicrobiales bacterium]|nr:Rieske 2Fe-2S domain-containing protein [Acidimicrobiales bacterium]